MNKQEAIDILIALACCTMAGLCAHATCRMRKRTRTS